MIEPGAEFVGRKQAQLKQQGKAKPASRTLEASVNSELKGSVLSFAAMALLVLAIVAAVHWPGLHAGALSFDDGEYLTNNPLVRAPSPANAWRFLKEVFEPSTVHGYYQPLTMISLMADHALGGRPDYLLPFHRTSLLLHLGNTLLVMLILYVLFRSLPAAGLAGLLFGVHPMTVETIVWVGERKTVLAAFFAFAAILAYLHYATRGRNWAFVLSLFCFALALLAKPTVTPLPICLLLLDYWPLNRLSRRAVLEKLPFLLIALVSAYITFESQRRTAVAVMPGQDDSVAVHYAIAHNLLFYPAKMLVPVRLSSHYAFPVPLALSNPLIAASVTISVVMIPLLVFSLRWTRAVLTGWLFFFTAIFPTLGVIGFTNVIAADKYAYWPALGFLLIVGWAVACVCRKSTSNGEGRAGYAPAAKAVLALGLLAAVALSVATRGYLRHWKTTESLFTYMVSLNDNAAAPLIYLGLELTDQGRPTEALPILAKAAKLAPYFEGSHFNLGNVLQKLGQHDAAIAAYRRAIEVKPDFADAFNNLGNALLAKGSMDQAEAAYLRCIELSPDHADAHYNLANVLVHSKRPSQAIEHYRTTIGLQPQHAAAHKNLAGVLWEQGRTAESIELYEQALRLQPAYWDVAVHLADFLADPPQAELRRPQRAVELAQYAVATTEGRDPGAWCALAVACHQAGKSQEAHAAAKRALQVSLAGGDPQLIALVQQRLAKYPGLASSQKPSRRQ